jgi:hypothetical protein
MMMASVLAVSRWSSLLLPLLLLLLLLLVATASQALNVGDLLGTAAPSVRTVPERGSEPSLSFCKCLFV